MILRGKNDYGRTRDGCRLVAVPHPWVVMETSLVVDAPALVSCHVTPPTRKVAVHAIRRRHHHRRLIGGWLRSRDLHLLLHLTNPKRKKSDGNCICLEIREKVREPNEPD